MPLLPISSIASLIFIFVNFKFDVWILLLTQKKPKKPWAAKDAGGYFLKLHVISLMLIIIAIHSLMSLTTLPKMCKLQQQTIPTSKVDSILMDVNDVQHQALIFEPPNDCTLTNTSFNALTLSSERSSMNYTKSTLCACQNACGPWINSINGYSPILKFISRDTIPSSIYSLINSVQLWIGVATILMVGRWNLMNTIAVDQAVKHETRITTKQVYDVQNKELRSLRKKLALQRQLNRESDAVIVSENESGGGGEGSSSSSSSRKRRSNTETKEEETKEEGNE
jgi:hypothetical protein